ncbi:MAG: rRNA (adenine-N6)-dimethyltransferase [Acidimicrobiaceae bacterium]|nr:rRNA (adenine-N6)-dimethyltransferase [Acidimicrobiaceae bacterium]
MSAGRARWGFHQLGRSWAARVVADAGIRAGDLVLDVGAGTGALTAPLVDCGARVVAIERHLGRAAELRQKFAADDVTVVLADALDLRLPRRPFRVVSNPPFSVTVALLRRLVAPGSRLERADIVVPWHTARRWAAADAPGARRWLRDFEVGIGRALPRSALSPPPPNGVAILVLARRTPRGQQSRFPLTGHGANATRDSKPAAVRPACIRD